MKKGKNYLFSFNLYKIFNASIGVVFKISIPSRISFGFSFFSSKSNDNCSLTGSFLFEFSRLFNISSALLIRLSGSPAKEAT